uniref:F-box domain-containing protein n=1 Tax=Steinernema glaseri TaxID=37863 RepID=A0A1I7YI68_9BILA
MNSVPYAFFEALCCQLNRSDLDKLKKTSGGWSTVAAIHHSKRRYLHLDLNANTEGTQVGIGFKDMNYNAYEMTYDEKYDWIVGIYVGHAAMSSLPEEVSLERFRRKVLPALQSLIHGWMLRFVSANIPQNLADSIFSGLHGCGQLIRMCIINYGGRCAEFVEHQISLGHLESLSLRGDAWPDTIKASLKSFLRSPKYEGLYINGSNLTLDYDMADSFIERFLKEHSTGTRYLRGKPSFSIAQLRDLHMNERRKRRRSWKRHDILAKWRGPNESELQVIRKNKDELWFGRNDSDALWIS